MPCEKDWIDIMSAAVTPVIALLGILIAWLQWKLSKSRFKHELFDRRYAIYEATLLYLNQILRANKLKNEERYTFLQNTKGAIAFFDEEIVNYLNDIASNSVRLQSYQSRSNNDEEAEILNWFVIQLTEKIDGVFKKHLKID